MSRATQAIEPPVLALDAVSKSFGPVPALRNVTLEVRAGEIHAVLGENGAGKSTLVKIVYGLETPDSGALHWRGDIVRTHDPREAARRGIGVVFQHFSLFETLTVAENLALALPGRLAWTKVEDTLRTASERWGLSLDPERKVRTLSAGERQRLEIIRCLARAAPAPKLLILDEPTAVLTPDAAEQLFETLRRLAEAGTAVLFISHKLGEVRALCDQATVLRRGEVTGAVDPARHSDASLARLMLGTLPAPMATTNPRNVGLPRLSVNQLTLPPALDGDLALQDVSLEVRSGEILGIAGVAGNGQRELLAILSGEHTLPTKLSNTVVLGGESVAHRPPAERRRRGLAYLPDDRLGRASVPSLSLAMNVLLTAADRGLVARGWIRPSHTMAYTQQCISDLNVQARGPSALARTLSGGNLQKFLLARELGQAPKVLVTAQPTWGVDVGAAAAIHRRLLALAAAGAAVLVVSEDLEELITLSTRIAVMYRGRLSPTLAPDAVTVEQLGKLMGGSTDAL